ncbi:hypothetical protein AHAS_Ahas07G0077200 [Arachis hypogaea]
MPRRGTPTLIDHLGVPLECWAWHASSWNEEELRAWHVRPWAWHDSTTFQRRRKKAKNVGVPLGVEGVARQLSILTWACHLSLRCGTPASPINKKKTWACHLSSGRGTQMNEPTHTRGVAC